MAGSDAFIAANLANWNDRAEIHRHDRSGDYAVARFLAGEETLHAVEAAELPDLRGLRVAHLQCHFGLDSLNLVRRGAEVVGLDFSPVAIAAARELAERAGLSAAFVEGSVFEAPRLIPEPADLVYVTWGALNWLPDIRAWARAVAGVLKPGGRFYLAEAHPQALMLEQRDGLLVPAFDLPTPPDRPIPDDSPHSYTGDMTPLEHARCYEWLHRLSDILGALAEAGLRLDWLREHERVVWAMWPLLVSDDDGRHYRLPDGHPRFPLSFSLMATKEG